VFTEAVITVSGWAFLLGYRFTATSLVLYSGGRHDKSSLCCADNSRTGDVPTRRFVSCVCVCVCPQRCCSCGQQCHFPAESKITARTRTRNESVPKIIINNTINLFLSTAINILLISNRDSFRALFEKIASVHFIWKIWEPALCQLYRAYFRSVWVVSRAGWVGWGLIVLTFALVHLLRKIDARSQESLSVTIVYYRQHNYLWKLHIFRYASLEQNRVLSSSVNSE